MSIAQPAEVDDLIVPVPEFPTLTLTVDATSPYVSQTNPIVRVPTWIVWHIVSADLLLKFDKHSITFEDVPSGVFDTSILDADHLSIRVFDNCPLPGGRFKYKLKFAGHVESHDPSIDNDPH